MVRRSQRHIRFLTALVLWMITFLGLAPLLAAEPELALEFGWQRWPSLLGFRSDGTELLTVSNDDTLKYWDVATGRLLRKVTSIVEHAWSAELAIGGDVLAVGHRDGTIELCDPATGVRVRTLEGRADSLRDLTFSRNGGVLASSSWDKEITIWDARSGAKLRTVQVHTTYAAHPPIALSPDGKLMASTGDGDEAIDSGQAGTDAAAKTVRLWDVTTGTKLYSLHGHEGPVNRLVFSPNGDLLISSAINDPILRLWDPVTGRQLDEIETRRGIPRIAFSPDGRLVAYSSHSDVISFWSVEKRTGLGRLHNGTEQVNSILFTPDSETLVVGSVGETLRFWDVKSRRHLRTVVVPSNFPLHSVAFSPDGQSLAAAGWSAVELWDLNGPGCRVFGADRDGVNCVAFSPDGARLASGYSLGIVRLWEMPSCRLVGTLTRSEQDRHSVAFSRDGRLLGLMSWLDGSVSIWDGLGKTHLRTLAGDYEGASDFAFSPDGSLVAVVADEKPTEASHLHTGEVGAWGPHFIEVRNVATGEPWRTFGGGKGSMKSVAFGPQGNVLAGGSSDGAVTLWEVATGAELLTVKGHTDWVSSVAFSPDGQLLASGSWDKTVKLWGVPTGTEVMTLAGHKREVWAVAFSPDGERLASTADDGTIALWQVSTGRLLVRLARVYGVGVPAGAWFAVTPDGYYDGTPEAIEGCIRFRVGEQLHPAAEFEEQYHRPDLVAKALRGQALE